MSIDLNFYYKDIQSLKNIETIKPGDIIDIENSGQVLKAPYRGNTYRTAFYRRWNDQGHGKLILLKQLLQRVESYAAGNNLTEWHREETKVGLENLFKYYSEKYKHEESYITDIFNQIFESYERIDQTISLQNTAQQVVGEDKEHDLIEDFYQMSSLDQLYSQPLNLGSQSLTRIPVSELQPGDIICAYQKLNTQPIPLQITSLQKLEGLLLGSQEKNCHNILHLEIVLEQKNGKITVAHSRPGNPPQFAIDTKRLDRDKTPTIVIRARSQELREEIVKVAYTTVHKGNKWRIKGFSTGDLEELKQVAKSRLTKPFKGANNKLLQMARLAVDSFDRFNKKDTNQPKSMSCAQYISNVLNSAIIRINPQTTAILNDSSKTREQKTQEIYELLITNKDILKPLGLFHSDTSPASLISHIVQRPNNWQTVGYIGYVPTQEILSIKDTESSNYPISSQELETLQLGSTSLIYKVFDSLGLWYNGIYVLGEKEEKRMKFLMAFAYLYSEQHQLNPRLVAEILCNKIDLAKLESESKEEDKEKVQFYKQVESKSQKFLEQLNEFQNTEKTKEQISETKYKSVTISHNKILHIAKTFIKNGNFKEELKQKIISTTYVDALAEQSNNYCRYINYGITTLGLLSSTLTGGATIVASAALGNNILGSNIKKAFKTWKQEIEATYREYIPTHQLRLFSRLNYGERPWLLFSEDKGKTWKTFPFEQKGDEEWVVKLNLQGDLTYKIFKGPWNEYDPDPMAGAKWQRTHDNQNITLPIQQIDGKKRNEDNQLIMLPDCLYPEWE